MTDLRQAAEMALEALEEINRRSVSREHAQLISENAITALRERLAQPEQEPVAWIVESKHGNWAPYLEWSEPSYLETQVVTPLYTAPPSIEAAVLAEREACAKVCETFYNHEAKDCAEAIRERSEK